MRGELLNETREKLMVSYAGLLDPNRQRHWVVNGLPALRLYDRNAVIAALTSPHFTHSILPLPKWLLRMFSPVLSGSVVQPEGEWHDNLRDALVGIISPTAIGSLDMSMANDYIERAARAGVPFDLARVTDRITYEVICDLMGVDGLKSDTLRRQFFGWMDQLSAASSPFGLPRQQDAWRFYDNYARTRLAMGLDGPIDHILRSELFTDHDRAALWYFIMISATITTSYTICAAWTLLHTMDDQPSTVLEEVYDDAVNGGGRVLTRAYQETIRFATPAKCRVLRVRRPALLDKTSLWPGQMVDVCFSSANRDALFEHPDVYNPLRTKLNRHIGFGIGDYECPGSGLSATVSRKTLAALFTHVPHWQIVEVKPAGRLLQRMDRLVLSPR